MSPASWRGPRAPGRKMCLLVRKCPSRQDTGGIEVSSGQSPRLLHTSTHLQLQKSTLCLIFTND